MQKFINKDNLQYLADFALALSSEQKASEFEEVLNVFLRQHNLELKHIAQALRIALTGTSVSPSIYEVLEFLGVDECKRRIEKLITTIKEIK